MLIELRQTSFGYRNRVVVRVEALALAAGQCIGIFGPNGSGKTTLVRGVMGLLRPISGEVRRREALRIAHVPQHRSIEMHWPMSALDVAAMQVSSRCRFGWLGGSAAKVRQMMLELNVADLAGRRFAQLSGGQQQRLILAGALADGPDVLVLDEPTEGLDVHSRADLMQVLRQRKAAGLGLVLVSHEVEDLIELADRVLWLHPGEEADEASEAEWIGARDLPARLGHHHARHAAAGETR